MSDTSDNSRLLTEDEAADLALEIFYELASDNLPENEIHRFNAEYPDHGYLETDQPAADWVELVNFEPDPNGFIQINIGIEKEEGVTHRLATILFSLDEEEKFCHIEWLPDAV